jgi:sulfur carrier protein
MKIVINGREKEFEGDKITPNDLAQYLKITGKRYAMECNGQIISRSNFSIMYIKDGDKLEIVGAVGGG